MKRISRFLVRRPVAGLALSFFVIILAGAVLLDLPWAAHWDISFLDALFTATSATCVTGLVVFDTGAVFTLFGKIVIMCLIQLGLLEIMGFAVIFFFILRKRAGIAEGTFLKEGLGVNFRKEAKTLLKFIFIFTFAAEFVGAAFLFLAWNQHFSGWGQAAFSSLFHAVSAFCNAGFSLFPDSLTGFKTDLAVNFLFMALIFSGSLGFLTVRELGHKLASVFKKEKKRISVYSRMIIFFALALAVLGACAFYFFEKESFSSLDSGELWLVSFFQSVTKTAGFNTVDIGELSSPTLLVLMFLMFVGVAPGSASGGIKAISLALIVVFVFTFLKRGKEVTVSGRSVSPVFYKRILVLVSVCLAIALAGTVLLLYTEGSQFDETLFEAISAFSTVGLSTGLTPLLSGAGKAVVIFLMYLGRITPLAVALIGLREASRIKIQHPEEKIYLG